MNLIPILFICLVVSSSCSRPKKAWSESKYRFMIWEFASALEKDYDEWDVSPTFDKNGKRIFKTQTKQTSDNYHHHAHYKKASGNGAKYDPDTHEGFEF